MKCLKCFAELKDGDWRCFRCGALVKSASGANGSPAPARPPRGPNNPAAIRQKGLQVFGCLGVLLLIGLALCLVVLPWRVARAWREAETFRETRTVGPPPLPMPVERAPGP
jgi:hypothetical protein